MRLIKGSDRRPRRRGRFVLAALLVLLGSVAAFPQGQTDPKSQEPERRSTLEYRQEKVLSHMRELEDRMFQLSELIRDTAPDHAARLVLGLQKSREQLLVEAMQEIREHIKEGELDEAEEAQRQVVFRLKELRELLLSTDLDLLLKLERLRKMNKSLNVVRDLRKEQGRLERESEKVKSDEETSAEDKETKLKNLRRDQQQTRKRTELQKSDVSEFSNAEMDASKKLDEAAAAMQKAEGDLKKGEAGQAAKSQGTAGDRLREAEEGVRKSREELLRELQQYIRNALIEAFLQMSDMQAKVNKSVQKQLTRMEKGATPQDRDYKALEDAQIDISTKARDLIQLMEETEYSLAMPVAMKFFREISEASTAIYRAKTINTTALDNGKQVIADVEACVNILTEEAKWAKKAPSDDEDAYRQIKLLTELQTLRMAQERIRLTTEAEASRIAATGAADAAAAAEKYRVATMSRWEKEIGVVTDRLQESGNNKYLDKEHPVAPGGQIE